MGQGRSFIYQFNCEKNQILFRDILSKVRIEYVRIPAFDKMSVDDMSVDKMLCFPLKSMKGYYSFERGHTEQQKQIKQYLFNHFWIVLK
jgi:hypothetical protein